jgi:transposase
MGSAMRHAMRTVANAIFYVLRTGWQWENLPNDYHRAAPSTIINRKWCLQLVGVMDTVADLASGKTEVGWRCELPMMTMPSDSSITARISIVFE